MHLSKFNIRELNKREKSEINGGANPLIPAAFALWLGNEIVNNWSDVKSGISDAYSDFTN
jgi:hypothetical protein